MRFAASVPWKDCYVYTELGEGNSDGIGWPLALNGTEIKKHGTAATRTSETDQAH